MTVPTQLVLSFLLIFSIVHLSIGILVKSKLNTSTSTRYSIDRDNRVIGGTDAEEGFAPYQVSLQYGYSGYHLCGGAIVNETWILTASHCVHGSSPENIVIVSGTNKYREPGAITHVKAIFTHIHYNKPEMHNDIALLQLNESLIFNEKTQPIALPILPPQDGDEVILTGWGSTVLWGSAPLDLQKVYLKFVSNKKCHEQLSDDPAHDVGHICTFTRQGEGACHGDSGGPLISNGVLIGLVNWGYPCALGVPDCHANVYYFRDWIRKTMSGNGRC